MQRSSLFLFVFWVCVSCTVKAVEWTTKTPLDEYVFSDDDAYSYKEIATYSNYMSMGVSIYVYNMTSLRWFDEKWSNQPVWYHTLFIAIPNVLHDQKHAVLVIQGDDNKPDSDPGMLTRDMFLVATLAKKTGNVAANLKNVPNQPLVYTGDATKQKRTEDQVLAWSWKKFLETVEENKTDPRYLVLFPMVKSAKKALDTIHTVVSKKVPEANIMNFAVAGPSKRGWTTWLLAAVDPRVRLACPIVDNLLNMPANLMHHYQSLGGWSFLFKDYFQLNLTSMVANPGFMELAKNIDPYNYRERLTIPKLLTSATNDEFFLLDETSVWWDDMYGPMNQLMVPNCNHYMHSKYIYVLQHIVAFINAHFKGIKVPTLNWKFGSDENHGWIQMKADPVPSKVRAWVGDSLPDSNRRDFRRRQGFPNSFQKSIPFEEKEVEDMGDGAYKVTQNYPSNGTYRAFFMEANWPGVGEDIITFTTEVFIIPEKMPFSPCHGEHCHGVLV